jgi:LysR family cyn operon transcriptional activator
MELRQLQYFVKAAETMNFTEAAAAVFITQSTLSQQIKQLEHELGILLFDRVGRYVRITEGGHVFLVHARKILAAVQKSKQAITELSNAATGELHLGVSYAFTSLLLPALVPFSTKYPGIKISITYGNPGDLEKKLRLSELDMMLAFHNESDDEDLEMQWLFSSSIVMVVDKSNPLAKLDKISLKDLAEQDLVLPGKGFSSREFMNELFYKNKIVPNVKIELNDVHSLLT